MDAHELQALLHRLAEAAALAPSSHNCQPWALQGYARAALPFALARCLPSIGDWSLVLVVSVDRRQALRALPTLEREMHISVGGFAALLLNLLKLSGFEVQSHWLPATASDAGQDAVLALLLTVPAQAGAIEAYPLWRWIQQRRTERGPFRNEAFSVPKLRALPHSLEADADAPRLQWRYVLPGAPLDALAAFYRKHAARDFRHGAAWRETYRYLDFSNEGRNASGQGMNIQSLFGPLPPWQRRLYQGLLHPLGLRTLGPFGLLRRVGNDFSRLVKHSAAMAYLSPVGATEQHAGNSAARRRLHTLAGEQVVDLALSLTREGQVLHPLSVALQHPDIEAELRQLLGCEGPVLYIARVGTPLQPLREPFRYRRAADAFCSFHFDSIPC